ncbi:MAG TPA: hypothetical protein PLF21_01030 [Exilispira sp.]|nr:hypothetical protein [Exilispira sp.]
MELLFISGSNKELNSEKIKLKKFKRLNVEEYFELEKNFANEECLFIIDKNSVKEENIDRIRKGKKPESIILLSDTLDWDKLIETFEKGETFM